MTESKPSDCWDYLESRLRDLDHHTDQIRKSIRERQLTTNHFHSNVLKGQLGAAQVTLESMSKVAELIEEAEKPKIDRGAVWDLRHE